MKLILLGPPGAGKGTQSKQLAQRLSLPHISTGDILRKNVLDQTSLGKEAKHFMESGQLVPDELVTKMLLERFSQPDVQKGFILDGYPRNINQAKTLDNLLKQKTMDIDAVVYLDTSDAVIIQRLTGRLVCSACGANFHIKNMPPKESGVCDNCGGSLYQRTDDKEETVRKRIDVYKKEFSSLLDYYQTQKKLFRISSDQDTDLVLEEIIGLSHKFDDSLKV